MDIMGQEYAPAPESYEAPMVNSVRAARTGDSGSVQVGGYLFLWDTPEGGFTGNGWYMNAGPFKHWPSFTTSADVTDYLRGLEAAGQPMNLNAVFQNWRNWYQTAGQDGLDDYAEFAAQYDYGCKILN